MSNSCNYLLSERIILPPNSGAGPIANWDKGVYRLLDGSTIIAQFYKRHLRIYLEGERLRGGFILKWVGPKETDWLWIKVDDEYADPFRRFPNVLTPEKIRELENKIHRKMDLRQIKLI